MNRRTLLTIPCALAAAGCGAPEPGDVNYDSVSQAWKQDLDGNPVGPDIPDDLDSTAPSIDSCGGGATENLLVADDFDYADHGEHILLVPNYTLYVCTDHFPLGSAARAEVQVAADLYNRVAGSAAHITLGTTSHKTIAQLFPAFPSLPTKRYFDVVDNSVIGFPCHGAGDTASWAMNTCRHTYGGDWNQGGLTDQFVISVNAGNYSFDTNPSATDYPRAENIAHELGHAFGLDHTRYWSSSGARGLLSTMQGNLPFIPSHDRGYLRYFFAVTPSNTLNLVASSKIRVPDAESISGFSNRDFSELNPTEIYLWGGAYYDCRTRVRPVFHAQWLNHGQVATSCTVKNRFRIGPAGSEASSAKITLKAWQAAKMPSASQDRIEVGVTIEDHKLASLSPDVPYELSFMVDRDEAYAETNESDNLVTSTITLRSSYAACVDTN